LFAVSFIVVAVGVAAAGVLLAIVLNSRTPAPAVLPAPPGSGRDLIRPPELDLFR